MLKEHLYNFYSTYLNNVLVYSSRSKQDYKEKVYLVIKKLEKVGFKIDIKKLEFSVKKIKYLRFIIKASVRISIDLKKVTAI